MKSAQEITILSVPRSGTNYFCECLGEFRSVLPLFEVFNSAGVLGLSHTGMLERISEMTEIPARASTDADLIAHFRTSPDESLKLLSKTARHYGFKTVSYKIFPQQLAEPSMQTVLADPGRTFAFISRRRLDTYISYTKAQQSQTWKQADTTELKINVDVDAFLRWSQSCDQWFEMCKESLENNGQTYVVFNYETDICQPKPVVVKKIRDRFASINHRLKKRFLTRNPKFQVQDRCGDAFEKIKNSGQVQQRLKELGRLDYAMDRPI